MGPRRFSKPPRAQGKEPCRDAILACAQAIIASLAWHSLPRDRHMLILLFVALMFLASLLQAILGFGSALVAVPLALLFLPKETVVCSMFMVGL